MLKPGVHECSISELQSSLQDILHHTSAVMDPVIFCCQKLWDGELAAYILTENGAIKAFYTSTSGKISTGRVERIDYQRIAGISTEFVQPSPESGQYHLTLVQDSGTGQSFILSFPKADETFQKVLDLLHSRIRKPA